MSSSSAIPSNYLVSAAASTVGRGDWLLPDFGLARDAATGRAGGPCRHPRWKMVNNLRRTISPR
jgi:hypothetical protein